MAETRFSFGKIVDFIDSDLESAQWTANLRDSVGGTAMDVAALRLSNGEAYALRKDDARYEDWAEFLREWQTYDQPIYVETSAESPEVEMILAPIVRRIEHVSSEPEDGRLSVNVFTSPLVHLLNTKHPRFEELRARLKKAEATGSEVLITTHPSTSEILDVHAADEEEEETEDLPNGLIITETEANLLFSEFTEHFFNLSSLPEDRARQEFNHLAAQRHIPFNFPKDCCTSRAHEMCRILRTHGIVGRKIWNYGSGWTSNPKRATLRVITDNDPRGFVEWTYHVAPVVSVRRDSGAIRNMVLDPAIFDHPVLTRAWRDEQQDDLSFWEITEDTFLYRDYFDFNNELAVLDPDFVETRRMLAAHRASLIALR